MIQFFFPDWFHTYRYRLITLKYSFIQYRTGTVPSYSIMFVYSESYILKNNDE